MTPNPGIGHLNGPPNTSACPPSIRNTLPTIRRRKFEPMLIAAASKSCGPMPTKARAISIGRSEEHTSELQSLMRISYAVFCLKKKTNNNRVKKNAHHKHKHQKQSSLS